jgi:hypothetical protein
MRLNHIADSESVDVDAIPSGKGASGLLATDLGQCVGVHGVDVVVFFQREGVVVVVALGKADTIRGL